MGNGEQECKIQEINSNKPLEFYPAATNTTLWFWAPAGAIFKMKFNRLSENTLPVISIFGIMTDDTDWKTAVIDWPGIRGKKSSLHIPEAIEWQSYGQWISSDNHKHIWPLNSTWKFRNLQVYSTHTMFWSTKDPKTLDLFRCHDFISNFFKTLRRNINTATSPPVICPTVMNTSSTSCHTVTCPTTCQSIDSSLLTEKEIQSTGSPSDLTSASIIPSDGPSEAPLLNSKNLLEGLAGAVVLCMIIIVVLSISYHRLRIRKCSQVKQMIV